MEKSEFVYYLKNKIYGNYNRKYADSTIKSYTIKLEIIEKNFYIDLDKEYKKDKCHCVANIINSSIEDKRNGRYVGICGSNGHEWGLSSLEECRSAIKAYIDFKDNEDKNYNYNYSYSHSSYNKKYIEKDLINRFLEHFNISKQEFREWIITELQDDISEDIL